MLKRLWNLAKAAQRGRPPVGTTPSDVVFAENKWRLLRYRAKPNGGRKLMTPILLVPSLINRHYVLDLLPGKSFAEWLVAQGHTVYAIDWGTPGDEDRFVTMDDVFDRYLGRAIRRAAKDAGQERVHLLGYCMGGLMTAIHAAVRPEHVASMVTLAAPVRFDGGGLLEAWTKTTTFDTASTVEAYGNVPWPLMQGAFHLLRPTLNLSKLVHMIDRAWDDEFLDGFLALETWGNDNVSFPGACWREYVQKLYRDDALCKGELALSGARVDLAQIRCPILAVTFQHDNIVPWAAAKELVDRVSSVDKEWLHLPGGHVGAVVSRGASKSLWPRLSAWWAARDAAPSATRPSAPPPAPKSTRPSKPPPSKRARRTV